jgi:hypothetical protein
MGIIKDAIRLIKNGNLADHEIRKFTKAIAELVRSGKTSPKVAAPLVSAAKEVEAKKRKEARGEKRSTSKSRKLSEIVGYIDSHDRTTCRTCFVKKRDHLKDPIEILTAEDSARSLHMKRPLQCVACDKVLVPQ